MGPITTDSERDMLEGRAGEGARLAMSLVVEMARIMGARRLLPVSSAHIDGGLYHGPAGLDFARRLVDGGGHVTVPTTLNVSSLDLLHPELYRGDGATAAAARELMDAYVAMGCRATWTCAPYQLAVRPAFGEQIAWAESNAIVFANSVLGARTERYGDFIDICAAITGRVPDAGLHRTEDRRARVVFDVAGLPPSILDDDLLYPVLGHLIGRAGAEAVPAIVGLPAGVSEDRLKALGAAAASSGSVALFHAVGSTPEAPTLEAALQGTDPDRTVPVTVDDLKEMRADLTTGEGPLAAVSTGTPHLSFDEIAALVDALAGRRVRVPLYASTGRDVLALADRSGLAAALEASGVTVVTDTCTYITPIMEPRAGVVMTNSAKWAFYAPGNLGIDVFFASLRDCVEAAVAGRIVATDEW